MLIWRLFAAVFAISAAFQFVYVSYFVPWRGNISAIDFIFKRIPRSLLRLGWSGNRLNKTACLARR